MTEPQTLDQGKTARATWLFALALILIALLLYRPAWHGQPVWDDDAHITHPVLRSWHGLVQIWTQIGATQQYYPLVHTAFWIEQKLWDDSFLGYHLVNILLHGATAVVLLQILLRLKIPGAWLGAALFALHPVQVESVAWISELKNTLSGAFFFCSILVYLEFDERRTTLSYVGSLFLFILGLLCKTAIAPLPGAIAVILWWKRGQIRFRHDLLPLIPFFLLGLLAGSFTVLFERIFVGAAGSEFQLSILQRCLIAGRDFWFYLFKLAWPAKLTFIYPRWSVSGAVWWQYLFPIGVLLILAYAWHLRTRNRGPLTAALIFLGLLLPALGFIDVFPLLYSFVADHFQYLACVAPLTLFAAGLTVGVERFAPAAKNFFGPAVSVCLLSILGLLSWRQAHDYRDIETLWRTTIARNPSCWMAYSNLGSFLSGMGVTDEAIQNFRRALELRPEQSKDHNNLGKALLQQGRFTEAMEEFQAALSISPNDPVTENNIGAAYLQKGDVDSALDHLRKAVKDGPRNGDAYINFGNALLKKRDFDNAIAAYSATLELPYDHAETHYSIANALRQKGENDDAILHYQLAIQLRPDYVDAHNNLANALRQQGRIEEAIQEYEAALKYRPQFQLAQNNLAWILATAADSRLRNGSKAVELAEKAVLATNGSDPILLHTLAAAYAENGEFEKAVAAARDSLAIADANGLTSLAESLRNKIALYQSGSAYHESAPPSRESSH
jgi:tetratricopeptide (TPR) repeat protein